MVTDRWVVRRATIDTLESTLNELSLTFQVIDYHTNGADKLEEAYVVVAHKPIEMIQPM